MSQSGHHAYKARFLIMIEITTGVAFLLSSLYGAGQTNSQVASIAAAKTKSETTITTEITLKDQKELKDPEDIENYVREQFKDEPILIEIAWCESRFKQFNEDGIVIRGRVNNKDVGVMQINEKYHSDDAESKGYDIYTVEGNIAFGKHLYEKFGTSPWNASAKCWSQSGDLAKK